MNYLFIQKNTEICCVSIFFDFFRPWFQLPVSLCFSTSNQGNVVDDIRDLRYGRPASRVNIPTGSYNLQQPKLSFQE